MKSLMKKTFFVVLGCCIFILFAGCSMTDVTNESLESMEIYNKSLEAVKAANSYEFEIAQKEFIQMPLPTMSQEGYYILDEEFFSMEEWETEIHIKGQLIQAPLSLEMIQKINVLAQQDVDLDSDSNRIELKIYMQEGKHYSYLSHWGVWAFQDLREIDIDWENLENINKQFNPMYFLNLLENDLARAALIETKQQHYILSLENNAEELIRKIMKDILGDNGHLSEASYKIWIDKETYLPTKSFFKYKLATDIGESTRITIHESEILYKNFGAIDKVEIPDEAKNPVDVEELLEGNIWD